jgi:energy-coupling factor transport system ATP-binding protein
VSLNRPIIELGNVNFKFPSNDCNILSNINLRIKEGEFIVITGISGSGKSTLALALSGFIPHLLGGVFSGEIKYQGVNTSSLTLTEISQLVGLVQQDPENQIVTPTVFEEIIFGPENLKLDRIEISERLKFSSNALRLGNLLSRSTNQLSGGEKQKVVIASILSMGGAVLVLDEPISFLDYVSQKSLLSTLKELNQKQNKTIIIIDHQPEVYKELASRYIVIDNGTIVTDTEILEKTFIKQEISNLTAGTDTKFDTPSSTLLEISNLTVGIKEKEILRKISLKLNSASIYGVIGRNGSGKTTLAKTLLNLHKYEGSILLNGKKIKKIPTHELARNIGIVYQNPNHQIFERTVFRELMFAPKNFDMDGNKHAVKFLEESKLARYQDFPPFGLSYGEKRRLTICSSEIYSPDILILDEPFIGQDNENFLFILNLIHKRKFGGKTTVIISHRSELFDFVDYFYILDNGSIIEHGSPTKLSSFITKQDILDVQSQSNSTDRREG